jgi:DNA (cytosine-5)-methyltransferase 1
VDTAESLIPVAFAIMPMNSGKDYKARETDAAQPVMAGGPVGGNQGGDYIVQPIAFSAKDHGADASPVSPTLRAMNYSGSHANAGGQVAIAFSLRGREDGAQPEVEPDGISPALRAAEGGSTRPYIADEHLAVRRITCVEAERLQGFPDHYTLIDWPTGNRKGEDLAEQVAYLLSHGFNQEEAERLAQTPDGPRYRAIGNSKAVPLVRKIGAAYAAALSRYVAGKAAA